MESRILGALSKLDEFLTNPQVRTCSVAVPGTSRNNNSENRETTEDCSTDDPCPEVRYFSHHSGHHNSPEAENYPNSFLTGGSADFCRYHVSFFLGAFFLRSTVNSADTAVNFL